MTKQLFNLIWANILLYRRNRLFLAFSLLLGFFVSANLAPVFFVPDLPSQACASLISSISWGIRLFSEKGIYILAFLSLVYNLKNKARTLVFTRPCNIRTWIMAQFMAPVVAVLIFVAVNLALIFVLSTALHVPANQLTIYMIIVVFFNSLINAGMIMFLATLLPPVFSVFIFIVASENAAAIAAEFISTISAMTSPGTLKSILGLANRLFRFAEFVFPCIEPYNAQIKVQNAHSFYYLLLSCACSIVWFSVFYFLSVFIYSRKRTL